MKQAMTAAAILAAACALPAAAEPVQVGLADYAFDFPKYGSEIIVAGETEGHGNLTADEAIHIRDDGYYLRAQIDRLGRSDRRQFIAFFNEHCTGSTPCAIVASGDIELNRFMEMIFRISTVKISKDGNEWTNASGN